MQIFSRNFCTFSKCVASGTVLFCNSQDLYRKKATNLQDFGHFREEIHRKFYAGGMTEMANESNRRLDTGCAKRDFCPGNELPGWQKSLFFFYGRAPFPPGTAVADDSFFAR